MLFTLHLQNKPTTKTMKCISYIGADGDCIVINQPTDIIPLLDWCQSKMIENQESCKGSINKEKWQKSIDLLSSLMQEVDKTGLSGYEYIDKVKY